MNRPRKWLGNSLRGAIRFAGGPIPLSIALHVAALLFLIITVHEQRGRELIVVNLEAGGGGGGGNELQDLDLPDVPMPEDAPVHADTPVAVTSDAVNLATDYVRSAGGGGIGIGRGGGIGSGYGPGIGKGFGGYIVNLRRTGLDVALVIDGTASMSLIVDEVRMKMQELVRSIHRLVPVARIGVVVFGGKGEPIEIQPLTMNSERISSFLNQLTAKGGGEWEENTYGAIDNAVNRLDWKPYARKVIVLVGDSPPTKDDFEPLLALVSRFRGENGAVNTVDVSEREHRMFEREFWLKVHRDVPPQQTALPGFYRQTQLAYRLIAQVGGGTMKALDSSATINQQVMVLVFGDKWEVQVKAFSRGLELFPPAHFEKVVAN
jgi:von Willebrand factor type A domain